MLHPLLRCRGGGGGGGGGGVAALLAIAALVEPRRTDAPAVPPADAPPRAPRLLRGGRGARGRGELGPNSNHRRTALQPTGSEALRTALRSGFSTPWPLSRFPRVLNPAPLGPLGARSRSAREARQETSSLQCPQLDECREPATKPPHEPGSRGGPPPPAAVPARARAVTWHHGKLRGAAERRDRRPAPPTHAAPRRTSHYMRWWARRTALVKQDPAPPPATRATGNPSRVGRGGLSCRPSTPHALQ